MSPGPSMHTEHKPIVGIGTIDDTTGVDTETGGLTDSDTGIKVDELSRFKTIEGVIVLVVASWSGPTTRFTVWQLMQTKTVESLATLCDVVHCVQIRCCSD